jgi:hypothetical protein
MTFVPAHPLAIIPTSLTFSPRGLLDMYRYDRVGRRAFFVGGDVIQFDL